MYILFGVARQNHHIIPPIYNDRLSTIARAKTSALVYNSATFQKSASFKKINMHLNQRFRLVRVTRLETICVKYFRCFCFKLLSDITNSNRVRHDSGTCRKRGDVHALHDCDG